MSKDKLTFCCYIRNYDTNNINKFIELSGDQIEKIPDKMVSSRYIMHLLNINSNTIYFRTFENVFMDYFKLILN